MKVKDKIIFLHILRTGGTTFKRSVLGRLYGKSSIYGDNGYKSRIEAYGTNFSEEYFKARCEGIPPIEIPIELNTRAVYDEETLLRAPVIAGHFHINKHESLKRPVVTFFRDPVSRLLSFYNHIKYLETISLKEFAKRYQNYMSYVIGGDLDRIAFIGITECYDESLEKFIKWSGLYNLLPKPPKEIKKYMCKKYNKKISREEREFITEINKEDYKLYNNALERFKKQ